MTSISIDKEAESSSKL